MIAALLVLALAICGLVVYLVWRVSEPPAAAPDTDPEATLRAAADLHRIRRRLDVAGLQHQQRRDANQLRRDIAEALETDYDAP